MSTVEVNFDGLVGTTHHYGGLAIGNRASSANAGLRSNPRQAARQGLDKMWALAQLGVPQGVLPPQPRPHVPTLRALGFEGSDRDVIARAAREAPDLLSACSSAAHMWAANAATVSASADCADRRVHFTAANLATQFHRSIEAAATARTLGRIFADPAHFVHHSPLPATPAFADEGAANHTRFATRSDAAGTALFVYGREAGQRPPWPARQSRAASEAIARQHGLAPARTVYARQNPAAIQAGVFHNDVIAVGHGDVMLCHEQAFVDQPAVRAALERALGRPLHWVEIPAASVDLATAVRTYLFNSQLVTLPDGQCLLVVPAECETEARVWNCLQELVPGSGPIDALQVMDVTQSMRNGGGPACLRLRVPLTEAERAAVAPGVLLDQALYRMLGDWIARHYRDRLTAHDLGDPLLLDENRRALDELTGILGLGALFDFQRENEK